RAHAQRAAAVAFDRRTQIAEPHVAITHEMRTYLTNRPRPTGERSRVLGDAVGLARPTLVSERASDAVGLARPTLVSERAQRSEPAERREPAQRRASDAAGESEGRSPSEQYDTVGIVADGPFNSLAVV